MWNDCASSANMSEETKACSIKVGVVGYHSSRSRTRSEQGAHANAETLYPVPALAAMRNTQREDRQTCGNDRFGPHIASLFVESFTQYRNALATVSESRRRLSDVPLRSLPRTAQTCWQVLSLSPLHTPTVMLVLLAPTAITAPPRQLCDHTTSRPLPRGSRYAAPGGSAAADWLLPYEKDGGLLKDALLKV